MNRQAVGRWIRPWLRGFGLMPLLFFGPWTVMPNVRRAERVADEYASNQPPRPCPFEGHQLGQRGYAARRADHHRSRSHLRPAATGR